MPSSARLDPDRFIGRPPDRLTLEEREALVGKYIARQIYTPKNLALQRIEALGDTVEECVAILRRRGLEPLNFEFVRLNPPY